MMVSSVTPSQQLNSSTTIPSNIQPPEQQKLQPPVNPDDIVNEIKSYTMESRENLEQVIKRIVKLRKGKTASIKWNISTLDNNIYSVTVTAKAPKSTVFKFNYESKNKILKPLNTLAMNTVKVLMEKDKPKPLKKKKNIRSKNKPQSNSTNPAQSQQKNIISDSKKDSTQDNQDENNTINNSDNVVDTYTDTNSDMNSDNSSESDSATSANTESNSDGEYLIIGE
jgi:hypothetical protein